MNREKSTERQRVDQMFKVLEQARKPSRPLTHNKRVYRISKELGLISETEITHISRYDVKKRSDLKREQKDIEYVKVDHSYTDIFPDNLFLIGFRRFVEQFGFGSGQFLETVTKTCIELHNITILEARSGLQS